MASDAREISGTEAENGLAVDCSLSEAHLEAMAADEEQMSLTRGIRFPSSLMVVVALCLLLLASACSTSATVSPLDSATAAASTPSAVGQTAPVPDLEEGGEQVGNAVATPQSADAATPVPDAPAETDRDTNIDSAETSAVVEVIVVTREIPQGTSARELVESASSYLSVRAVPQEFIHVDAISTVGELQELAGEGFILSTNALPGEQLLKARFRSPADFDADGESSILESATSALPPPDGDEPVTIELGAAAAVGGQVRPGDRVLLAATDLSGDKPVSSLIGANLELLAISSLPAEELSESDFSVEVVIALSPEEKANLDSLPDAHLTLLTNPSRERDPIMMIVVESTAALDGEPLPGSRVDIMAKGATGPGQGSVLLSNAELLGVFVRFDIAAGEEGDWSLLFEADINDALGVLDAVHTSGVEVRAAQ